VVSAQLTQILGNKAWNMDEEPYVQNIRLPVCARALKICLGGWLGEGHLFAGQMDAGQMDAGQMDF
jgi:hypothetical protein